MRKVTVIGLCFLFIGATGAFGQQNEYLLSLPTSADLEQPYAVGLHSGARGVSGPFDLDQDGKAEVLVMDYTGGGRVHVVETQGVDIWELVYSTPWLDSTATTSNARYATGGDLDGDGNQEIIFVTGRFFSATNPNADVLKLGVYVFEHTGSDDDYGTLPATVGEMVDPALGPVPATGTIAVEHLEVLDIDQDGVQEVLLPVNGPSALDHYYIYSVNGTYEPNGAGTGFETWVMELRVGPRENGNIYGGGSPLALHAADLDGDGTYEISFHAWNKFNFFNADVAGPNTYVLPDTTRAARNYIASPTYDLPSLVGGVVADVNGDGRDEVFYPSYDPSGGVPAELQTTSLSVLHYEPGENVLEITPDNFQFEFLGPVTDLGVTAGDLDGDGRMEIIGTGPGYTGSAYTAGTPSTFLTVAEFTGDATDSPGVAANYTVESFETPHPSDTTGFNVVHRDSLGTLTTYYVTEGSATFPAKIAYLGDPDDDGFREVALSFQAADDSVYVIDEVWDETAQAYTRDSTKVAVQARPFMRILASNGISVSIEEDRVVMPTDYRLSANFPNPFNPATTFTYTLPVDKSVSVRIYDVAGRLVKTLVGNEFRPKGTHTITWDGTSDAGQSVASGTYLYTLEYGTFRQARSMVLLK